MAQVVECLPSKHSKHEALVAPKKKKKKRKILPERKPQA
jgi:hypothetical protein